MPKDPRGRAISYSEARGVLVRELAAHPALHAVESTPLELADTRVLAVDVSADRDYPPLDRAARDGFAVRSADMPGSVRVIGEVRAGDRFEGPVGPGEAIEIMTGAPVPEGADAILMVEHVTRRGHSISYPSAVPAGQHINVRGGEAACGTVLLKAGARLSYAEIALLAAVGCSRVAVYAKPRIAILATGDELVPPSVAPEAHQIRNSNAYSLAAQVKRAGGTPEILGVARDNEEETRGLIDRGLASDLLLLSGGVSAGKYDVVESALRSLGAEFYFDRVAIQPGQPLVFGRAKSRFFFGLPGNPASTMLTFELFARSALEALAGEPVKEPVFLHARLTADYRHRPGLTRFLPAHVCSQGQLTPIGWTGSSDIAALTRANAFMVVDAARETWHAGDEMPVLLK